MGGVLLLFSFNACLVPKFLPSCYVLSHFKCVLQPGNCQLSNHVISHLMGTTEAVQDLVAKSMDFLLCLVLFCLYHFGSVCCLSLMWRENETG